MEEEETYREKETVLVVLCKPQKCALVDVRNRAEGIDVASMVVERGTTVEYHASVVDLVTPHVAAGGGDGLAVQRAVDAPPALTHTVASLLMAARVFSFS